MASNDIYEVTMSGHIRREYVQTQIHVKERAALADAIPARAVADLVHTDWVLTLAPLLAASEVGFDCIYVRRVQPTAGIAWTKLVSEAGESGAEAIPSNSALVVSWVSNVVGTQGRGRNWIWGLAEADQNSGVITVAALAAFNDWVADLMLLWGNTGTSDLALVVYSPTFLTGQNVIDGVVRTNLGVMRSRRQRPGTSA